MWPWPRAFTAIGGHVLQVHGAQVVEIPIRGEPGVFEATREGLVVRCGIGALCLDVVQSAGGRASPAISWYAGFRAKSSSFDTYSGMLEKGPLVTQLS
jgi:methionyl-tRNA formyltransferase